MAQKAPLLFSIIAFMCCFISCNNNTAEDSKPYAVFVTSTKIPHDTIFASNANLKLDNGIYYLNKSPFNGYVKSLFAESRVSNLASYLNGKQHGVTLSYYTNGKLKDKRSYKNGKSFGKQIGFWENGHQKYEFFYNNDKREGLNKQWYESGKPYCNLTYKEDREEGMQKAWRENGSIYINYEVKDGERFGLQKSALCYTLIDQKLKSK